MNRFLYSENSTSGPYPVYIPVRRRKRYGVFKFFFDCLLVFITGGLWLIWIFVREMRRR